MRNRTLLELVWQGAIRPADGVAARQLARLLKDLLPVDCICLTATSGLRRSRVLSDETELMPALPLGDVLAEEMGLDVPYGSLVVIEEAGQASVSRRLGAVVAELLLGVVRLGMFPLHRESDALYMMACAFARRGAGHPGIDSADYRSGLAAGLGAFWTGTPDGQAEPSGLFDDPDFLENPALRAYLSRLDAGFRAPLPQDVPQDLLAIPEGVFGYEAWAERVARAVNAAMARSEDADPLAEMLSRRSL